MFLTQIVNTQITELTLCEDCARERGLFDPQSLTFAEKFFPDELKQRVDRIVQELSAKCSQPQPGRLLSPDVISQCPACQFTLEAHRRTGRLGCPDCYSVFARELGTDLSTVADMPGKSAPTLVVQRAQLERQLYQAIEREDYENAARLRDELKNLQS